MSLHSSCSWAWSLSLPPQPPQPPGYSYFTPPLCLRLQRLTPVPFLRAITHCQSVYHLGGDLVVSYQFSLSNERNTTLSTSGTEENLIPLDSPPFSDSALDSMSPIMSGNRVWSTLEVAWRRTLLHEIASALVEVISPLRNTSVVFELVIYEEEPWLRRQDLYAITP
ncbi:hypothetical protein J5N97_025666 [Dioscorea zingiberensis]|uniref:Uncharacterized protein n=1 Tax=Dioscorea zingiberensis TaxID=325984 RepID=A0A9D5C209_9LILI|nr:hypothetical protein J5N97_025666 [Dioscorea zingiberensis]